MQINRASVAINGGRAMGNGNEVVLGVCNVTTGAPFANRTRQERVPNDAASISSYDGCATCTIVLRTLVHCAATASSRTGAAAAAIWPAMIFDAPIFPHAEHARWLRLPASGRENPAG